jgi:diguanylate cyclase (GGDEF)-like protein/PAS domain S-box-containing protein
MFRMRCFCDWTFSSCNRAATELFDASQEQLRGKTLADVFGSDALQEDGRTLPDICADSARALERESYLAVRRSDFWLEFNWWHFKFVPIDDGNGHVGHIAGICRMITEMRQTQEALKKFSSAITQAQSIMAIVEMDGTVEYVNPIFESVTGFSCASAIGQRIIQLSMPSGAEELYAPLIAAMARQEAWQGELPGRKLDGSVYWEHVRVSPISVESEMPSRFLFIKEDISARRAIENELRLASRVLDTTDAGVMITDDRQRIVKINPAFTRITGYGSDEALGQTPRMLHSGKHDKAFYAQMWSEIGIKGHWSGELVDRKKSGEQYVEQISISALSTAEGKPSHYVGVFSDITALRESQVRLEQMANFDVLTQLPNRRQLTDRLQNAVLRARRENSIVALVYFDLDHFKAVNDTLGHPAGDALLKEVSRRVLQLLRDEDTLARLGGDEFVVVLEGVEIPERISVVAERIIHEMGNAFILQGHEVFVGCSLGVAFFPRDGDNVDTLMRNADLALYRAKEDGRNCYRLYSEEMNANAHVRYQTEIRLRKAIESGELSVVFQPQFNAATRRLVGAEALLRWSSRDVGHISPALFIPIAEQTGVIVPIGRWVMEQVCQMQKSVIAEGLPPVKVAVNVSPVQFRQKDLVETFRNLIHDAGIPVSCIEIEVTETAIMTDADKAIAILTQLRDLGLTIAVDDFGTGYSSLGYLKRFPLDKIKIDRTFVSELETNPDDAVIISAIIAMSHSLGMKTLAEGVETETQLSYLNISGCDEIQGFLLGKPLSIPDFLQLLRES